MLQVTGKDSVDLLSFKVRMAQKLAHVCSVETKQVGICFRGQAPSLCVSREKELDGQDVGNRAIDALVCDTNVLPCLFAVSTLGGRLNY